MIGPRPRVLFVGAFPPPGRPIFGGMVTSCRALLASTLPAHVELDLFDSTQASNPPPSLPVRLVRAVTRLARFIGRFEARRPDAVMLFVAVGASIVEKGVMAWYSRLRGVPAVMLPRGGAIVDDCQYSAFTRVWTSLWFRGARKIVCQSEKWQEFAIQSIGIPRRDVAVIRNWTATRELLEIGARRTTRRESPVRLLFVGWLERDKGIFDLIDACRHLAQGRKFSLDVAGEGHASIEARALVAQYGLTGVIRFRGWLQAGDLELALSDADVFVLPSWGEGLPNAMVEAMATRLAVVVTGVGAIPEVVIHRRSGLIVVPKDAESLRGALAEVIDDSELRERLGAEAFQSAARSFGVEAAVDRLVEVIESAISGVHGRVTVSIESDERGTMEERADDDAT